VKKSSLKDWFKFQVWRQSGGTLPELCDLSEIREWLNETADDPDLDARISIVEAFVDAFETTAVNGAPDTPVAATAALAIGTGVSLDFAAKTAGFVGNSIAVELLDPGADGELSVSVAGNIISVTLGYASKAIKSSLADIKKGIEDTPAAHALVAVSVTGSDATLAIAVAKTALENGVPGTVGAKGALRFDSSKLYVSVDESTVSEDNWLAAPLLPTLPTVIDLSDASEDYVIEDEKNSIVVLTNNAAPAKGIVLPAAIVGLRVTIINQDNASVDISPASGEYINGSDSTPFTLTKLNSATFYCYVDGYWAII
jgi:hypothetical protein